MNESQEGQKTILLVEDEAIIAMAEKRLLEKHKFHVLTASSGEKAIETVNNNGSVDLILIDINLGNGMDGTQAAEIILRERDIPVIFLSTIRKAKSWKKRAESHPMDTWSRTREKLSSSHRSTWPSGCMKPIGS